MSKHEKTFDELLLDLTKLTLNIAAEVIGEGGTTDDNMAFWLAQAMYLQEIIKK
jgi:hypothetical protein